MYRECIICGRPLKTGRKYCYACRSLQKAQSLNESNKYSEEEKVIDREAELHTRTLCQGRNFLLIFIFITLSLIGVWINSLIIFKIVNYIFIIVYSILSLFLLFFIWKYFTKESQYFNKGNLKRITKNFKKIKEEKDYKNYKRKLIEQLK